VTEQIRSIPKDSFKKSFQPLYELCKLCIDWQGDYVEHWGNKFFLTWTFWMHSVYVHTTVFLIWLLFPRAFTFRSRSCFFILCLLILNGIWILL
jgi:hypothetical protein